MCAFIRTYVVIMADMCKSVLFYQILHLISSYGGEMLFSRLTFSSCVNSNESK